MRKFDPQVQRIVLGLENVQAFVDTINKTKEQYQEKVVESISERREVIENPKWEVPAIINHNSKFKKETRNISIMRPYYTKKPSMPEKLFIDVLDTSKKVKWWFKNGETEIKYFAVPYKDETGYDRSFYVDFIIQFEDGTIGLFDTKSGITAKDSKTRAESLQKYIKEQNKKGKNLWGGIVIHHNGSWRYNDKATYNYNEKDMKGWEFFNLI